MAQLVGTALGLALVTCLVLFPAPQVMTIEVDMAPDLQHCYETFQATPGANGTEEDKIHAHCIQEFLWKKDRVRWSDYNVTNKDFEVVNTLTHSLLRRSKRAAKKMGHSGPILTGPATGFSLRREYRRLSDFQRTTFNNALRKLKKNGVYDTFANIHRGIIVLSAHLGPNFFTWHRVFLALFEEALRRLYPKLSLPYWDSTMDYHIVDPVDSILWTPPFFGTGSGFVISGSFAHWPTPVGPLTRNIGAGSRLISKMDIHKVLSRCRLSEISEPTAKKGYSLERIHGGVHIWVSGQMAGLNTAGHDPIFFLHHAFIDYIWELFRRKQRKYCGINPDVDYPPAGGYHAPLRPMDAFPRYRNIDGASSIWTRLWYDYEPTPSCSPMYPHCGSPYLRCDKKKSMCLTQVGTVATPFGGVQPVSTYAGYAAVVARGRAQASQIRVGPTFIATGDDPRSQRGRAFAAAL